jgi:hypothetical protein
MNITKILLTIGLVPLILSGIFYYVFTQDLLGGKSSIRNGYENITIYANDHAIKFIEAETFEGAIYGLGFA